MRTSQTLEVIGSNLLEKTVAGWEYAMEHYKRIPSDEIQEILKVSFDALEEEQAFIRVKNPTKTF